MLRLLNIDMFYLSPHQTFLYSIRSLFEHVKRNSDRVPAINQRHSSSQFIVLSLSPAKGLIEKS